jgi:RNA polymerase sigma-70 factor, ECF subfamily
LEALAGTEATRDASETPRQRDILRNMAGLRAQLARVSGSLELASDLLQDAVVTALQKLRDGEISDPAHLDGYVYRVALNHLRNHRRKDRLRVVDPQAMSELSDGADSYQPSESLEADQWARAARELLREVSPRRDRELLVRFYLLEEAKEDLCRDFKLTEMHFNRVIYRARDRFRVLLQRRGLGKADFLTIAAVLILAIRYLSAYGIHAT